MKFLVIFYFSLVFLSRYGRMANEENENKEDKQAEAKPKKDWKKILGITFIITNMLFVCGSLFVVYSNTLGYVADPISEEIARIKYGERIRFFEGKPIVFNMDPFVVNLTGNPSRTIQLELSLELINEEGYEEVITKNSETRDKIVRLLNQKTFDDLETIQGKLRLKDQIIVSVNQSLVNGVVKGVYFTNFVVQ